MRHQEKKKGIRRDVQVEIEKAMHEKAAAANQAGELQGARKGMIEFARAIPRLEEEHTQEPGAAEAPEDAGVGKGFEIVVVGVVHDFAVEESFVGRENDLQGAEAGTKQGMSQKDVPGVTAHGSALCFRGFERLQRREPLENLPNAEPGNNQQRSHQNARRSFTFPDGICLELPMDLAGVCRLRE